MQWSWLCSLLVLIRNVNLKLTHWQAERWSSGSRRIVVRMSANISDHPACQQGIGEGYRGQRPWQEEQSVLYIHGSLGCTKLFCALPCAQSLTMSLLCACVGNFVVKKLPLLFKFFSTRIYNIKTVTRIFSNIRYMEPRPSCVIQRLIIMMYYTSSDSFQCASMEG